MNPLRLALYQYKGRASMARPNRQLHYFRAKRLRLFDVDVTRSSRNTYALRKALRERERSFELR
jgi:hypothetical protein